MTISDRFLLAGAGAALIAAAFGIWLLIASTSAGSPADSVAFAHDAAPSADAPAPSRSAGASGSSGSIVVDVEGGVLRPGIVTLASGARVADAIRAAGGYSAEADLLAASQLNLAAALTDGQQVFVPLRNVTMPGATGGAGGGSGGPTSGPLNLNQATPEQLDALPGIGPVTVQKIVAARQDRPFATLDELVERKVLTNGQLDKIRDMVTLG